MEAMIEDSIELKLSSDDWSEGRSCSLQQQLGRHHHLHSSAVYLAGGFDEHHLHEHQTARI